MQQLTKHVANKHIALQQLLIPFQKAVKASGQVVMQLMLQASSSYTLWQATNSVNCKQYKWRQKLICCFSVQVHICVLTGNGCSE